MKETTIGKGKCIMKKGAARGAILAVCLALLLFTAAAETREGVIYLEGMEEAIEETRFDSPEGFSFWVVTDGFAVDFGEDGDFEGARVRNVYSDDCMILSMITREEAEACVENLDEALAEQSADGRAQVEAYCELEDGMFHFLTLIEEDGRFLRAVGEYSREAAEGTAKYFQRVLDSVAFTVPDV